MNLLRRTVMVTLWLGYLVLLPNLVAQITATHGNGIKAKTGSGARLSIVDPYKPTWPVGMNCDNIPCTGTVMDTEYPNTTGYTVVNVASGGNLQTAIDNANCGTIIKAQAGATFVADLHFPAKDVGHNGPCDGTPSHGWIIFQSDDCNNSGACTHLQAQHSRVCPDAPITSSAYNTWAPAGCADQPYMVTVKPAGADGSHCILAFRRISNCGHAADTSTAYYRIGPGIAPSTAGIAIAGGSSYVAISVGYDAESDTTLAPSHIVFDRIYLHANRMGQTGDQISSGFYIASGQYIAIVDSYLSEIHYTSPGAGEEWAILAMGYRGPLKIVNNRIDGTATGTFLGGAYIDHYTDKSWDLNGDTEYRLNYLWKNWPTWAGIGYTTKNSFETKFFHRLAVEGNVADYSWSESQFGGFVLKSSSEDWNCDADRCNSKDALLRFNLVRHNCIPWAGPSSQEQLYWAKNYTTGQGGAFIPQQYWPTRWWVHDNLSQDTNYLDSYVAPGFGACYPYDAVGLTNSNVLYEGGLQYYRFEHNTFPHTEMLAFISSAQNPPNTGDACSRAGRFQYASQGQRSQWCDDHILIHDNIKSPTVYNEISSDNTHWGDNALIAVATQLESATTPYKNVTGISFRSNPSATDGASCTGSACAGVTVTEQLTSCAGGSCYLTAPAQLGMVNYVNCNSAVDIASCGLTNVSIFHNAASDCSQRTKMGLSCDIGVDTVKLTAITACVVTGVNCR